MPRAPIPIKHDNVALAKAEIERGDAGDKSAGFDPAAAPLGTDDEAGGAHPAYEPRPTIPKTNPNAVTPANAPSGGPSGGLKTWAVLWVMAGVVLVLAAIMSALVLSN